jgi:low affinity Fe/Cu permease
MSHAFGTSYAFVLAVVTVVVWAAVGPAFHFNDSWQLTINTGTTIVTFLMVFLIQNTQNREARANQLKLDELLRAVEAARTSMVNVDQLSDEQLVALEAEFRRLGKDPGKSEEGATAASGATEKP